MLVDRFFTGRVAPQYQTRIKVWFRPRPFNLFKRLHDVWKADDSNRMKS